MGAEQYRGFCEHLNHLFDYYAQYQKTLKKQKSNKTNSKAARWHNESFTIRPWNRDPLRDLLLGLDVNCCLAPNGGQFQAIVERLMDVGMAVIEIIDKDEKTVALSWMYLAIDKNDAKKPYMVSNFHEISNQFAGVPKIRDFLINGLMEYSKGLAKHLEIGYLVSPLEYGLIPDFKGLTLKKNVSLEKIGGFFKSADDEEGSEYYIASLEQNSFWVPCVESRAKMTQVMGKNALKNDPPIF